MPNKGNITGWITIGGKHIPLKDGQSARDIYTQLNNKKQTYTDNKYKYLPDDEEEAHDMYWDMSDECYDKLDAEDRDLINSNYVKTTTSYDINSALRNDAKLTEREAATVKALDKACNTYTTRADTASTRFVDFDYLRNVYKLDIPVFKEVNKQNIVNEMKNFIGTELSAKGFTSVSLTESGNGLFNNLPVQMKINIPKGTKMYVAENWGEAEAILGRNTKMVLKNVTYKEHNYYKDSNLGRVLLTYEVVD